MATPTEHFKKMHLEAVEALCVTRSALDDALGMIETLKAQLPAAADEPVEKP